jgi:predicted DNA-binding transcriptional regulator AlpA
MSPLMKLVAANDNVEPMAKRARGDILPTSLPPRGLRREEAAAYIGVSPSTFDKMVADGRMPIPKRINARTVWDRKSELISRSMPCLMVRTIAPIHGTWRPDRWGTS